MRKSILLLLLAVLLAAGGIVLKISSAQQNPYAVVTATVQQDVVPKEDGTALCSCGYSYQGKVYLTDVQTAVERHRGDAVSLTIEKSDPSHVITEQVQSQNNPLPLLLFGAALISLWGFMRLRKKEKFQSKQKEGANP